MLLGARNGHGKTSLLFALYVGLFGRFGLRHAEGVNVFDNEDTPRYREAIRRFRRSGAPSDEPTTIEIVFTPTKKENDEHQIPEIRVIRRWFFSSFGSPKPGENFETLELYLDDKPQKLHTGVDSAIPRLERFLFKADVMPAFFFDGEQAQTLINNSGQDGMKKAVEVLFGTKVVEEALTTSSNLYRLQTLAWAERRTLILSRYSSMSICPAVTKSRLKSRSLKQRFATCRRTAKYWKRNKKRGRMLSPSSAVSVKATC